MPPPEGLAGLLPPQVVRPVTVDPIEGLRFQTIDLPLQGQGNTGVRIAAPIAAADISRWVLHSFRHYMVAFDPGLDPYLIVDFSSQYTLSGTTEVGFQDDDPQFATGEKGISLLTDTVAAADFVHKNVGVFNSSGTRIQRFISGLGETLLRMNWEAMNANTGHPARMVQNRLTLLWIRADRFRPETLDPGVDAYYPQPQPDPPPNPPLILKTWEALQF